MKARNVATPTSVLARLIIDMKPAPNDRPLPGTGGPVSRNPQPIARRLDRVRTDVERFLSDIRGRSRQIPVLVPEKERAAAAAALSRGISTKLDEWCGSAGQPKFSLPQPRPYELLIRGALIHEAAMRTSDMTLRQPLEEGAAKLFDAAFSQFVAAN